MRYYRNCLANVDQKRREVDTLPFSVPNVHIERLPAEEVKKLWANARRNGNQGDNPIAVEIAPVVYYPSYEHSKSSSEQEEVLYPFWIPAYLSRDGTLQPISKKNVGNEPPIFVQEYLLPDAPNKIADSARIDSVLKEMNSFRADSWAAYWKLGATFFEKVTGRNYASLSSQLTLTVKMRETVGATHNLHKLYSRVIKDHPPLALLDTLLLGALPNKPSAMKPLPTERDFYDNAQHLGQMHNSFPAAPSQRQAVNMYTATRPGEILSISGPPGTGKTTLLQSIVATAVVDRVVRQEEPALIVASSTNNQAITNILDGFRAKEQSSPLARRWLPDLPSLGLYMSGKQQAAYPTLMDCYGRGFVDAYEEEEVAEKIAYFQQQYAHYFQQSLKLEEAKDALYRKVKQRKKQVKQALKIAHQVQAWQEALGCSDSLTFRERVEQASEKPGASQKANQWRRIIDGLYQRFFSNNPKHLSAAESWQAYTAWRSQWDQQYGSALSALHSDPREYQRLGIVEDTNVRLDISYRFEAFWLAIHFREADYLLRLQARQEQPPDKRGKERGKEAYADKLHRIACLTPVFISTFHSLPRYATYYQGKEHPHYGVFDLLIVDEAGQVAPDVGVPAFALAQKAVVVGDAQQIEPVWSVTESVDYYLIKKQHRSAKEKQLEQWRSAGRLAASGNLMKMAQEACAYGDAQQRGGFLTEHRRCLDPIIGYANQYVYRNRLIPKVGEQHQHEHTLPNRGYFHINSVSQRQGTSRVNLVEAQVIAQWLQSQKDTLLSAYLKQPIHKIVAIVSPYRAQADQIKKALKQIDDRSYKDMIIGTVHALQGAECPIILYASVLSPGDATGYVDQQYNLLNVATTRAKHSFLVFGHMGIFDPTQNNALGNLAKWLYAHPDGQLSNHLFYESEAFYSSAAVTKRISTFSEHMRVLQRAFTRARQELIIASPFISSKVIDHEGLLSWIAQARTRGVTVIVYTDCCLDRRTGASTALKENARKGRQLLEQSGVELRVVNGIHNKTILIDDDVLVEGSFNWLSAVRDDKNPYQRYEASIVLVDNLARKPVIQAKQELADLYRKTRSRKYQNNL